MCSPDLSKGQHSVTAEKSPSFEYIALGILAMNVDKHISACLAIPLLNEC